MADQGHRAAGLVLVTGDGVHLVTTTSIGMDLVGEVARLLGSEHIGSTRLGGDLTLWHAEDGPGRPRAGYPNQAASGLAAEYGSAPVAGPAVISGPIADNTIYPLMGADADRLVNRLRGNGATPPPAEDCANHSPCREVLSLPARQRDSLFRLVPARSSDLGPDAIYVYLNDEMVALLVAMAPGESGSFQQAYPVLGHLAARWGTTPNDLIMHAITNMRADDVEVTTHTEVDHSPLHVVVDQGVSGFAQIVRLEELIGADLPNGAVIGIPREHQIIAVPIREARDLAAIAPVLNLVRNVGENALDQVSTDIFWLHRGRLHPLRAEVKNGQLEQIYPPDEFMQLVERLPR
ncbi:hypothetical protein ACQPW3_25035 [Actinosynnema sp. CA-248983]